MPTEPRVSPAHHRILLTYPVCAVLIAVSLLLTSCQSVPSGFSGGETVTPEKLREISASIFTDHAEPETSVPLLDHDLSGYTGEVWWTEGGSVIHTDRECYHISRALSVQSGSPADAARAGKTTLCATCRKHMHETVTDVHSDPASGTP